MMLLPGEAPNIFAADMLRSGSTHVQMGLCNMLGWRPVSATRLHGEGQGEQGINPITLSILVPYGYQVFGGHTPAYADTLMYLRNFGMRPLVTIRNLYDTVVSIKDRIDQTWPNRMMPGLFIPTEWIRWSDEEQYTWLAYVAASWQLKFYVSWIHADIEKLFVKYEEFYADQRVGFKRIYDFYQMPHPGEEALAAAVSTRSNNFNKGVSGRGSSLPRSVRKIIDSQVAAWGKDNEREVRENLYA